MKERDILEVKTYSDPSYIFSGGQDPQLTPLYICHTAGFTDFFDFITHSSHSCTPQDYPVYRVCQKFQANFDVL